MFYSEKGKALSPISKNVLIDVYTGLSLNQFIISLTRAYGLYLCYVVFEQGRVQSLIYLMILGDKKLEWYEVFL